MRQLHRFLWQLRDDLVRVKLITYVCVCVVVISLGRSGVKPADVWWTVDVFTSA